MGFVTSAVTGAAVVGAEVRIGDAVARSRANGSFEFIGLTPGPATLRATAAGFENFEIPLTVTASTVAQDVGLTRIQVFEFGDFALYIPETVDVPRALLVALGGPNTKGFVTGQPLGAPIPAVEASLQTLGEELRTMASTAGLAMLGYSRAAMPNGAESDQLLRNAIANAAMMSGRPELASVPVLMYGLSGGARQASGFTARNPERVAGLFLKVPAGVESIAEGAALRVPTYMVQAELDVFVNNATLTTAFEGNRRAGALWALTREAGVAHHSLSEAQRALTLNWMSTILELRLPATAGSNALANLAEASGWLGDRATGDVAAWDAFTGDRRAASWLPSQTTAQEWESFAGVSTSTVTASAVRSGAARATTR
jgi:hypothetical protein